ncbi:phosphatidylcholine synthase [Stieleria sp. TO1_6]|uniref:CDP-alcohol phosphatidyltransferase family protein n=1 Tax=Stieleria tagensis TaxID=2956795 RepID=UPI00209B66F5|nr:CDP-alcohol phosphatidyltransferase family protein [Stieleria tagensis]MCO8123147.1 phosphatidylcholine synthase [Stieleria tagensis]
MAIEPKRFSIKRVLAYSVHLLTVSGIVPAALAVMQIASPDCDPRLVFLWLLLATLIDAIDGPLARKFDVKHHAPAIDGRTIDDLLDYLTFAFIPLLLIWRMDWMPPGWSWTVIVAMGASLIGFAHSEAKDETHGFFRGFPSYWNAFALYAGILSTLLSPWLTAALLWVLTVLTVSPVRVLYPNLAPARWKPIVLTGALIWAGSMLYLLYDFPRPSLWAVGISLLYPLFYALLSFYLWHDRDVQQ